MRSITSVYANKNKSSVFFVCERMQENEWKKKFAKSQKKKNEKKKIKNKKLKNEKIKKQKINEMWLGFCK